MQLKSYVYTLGALFFLCSHVFGESGIVLQSGITIGRNLETYASLKLSEPAPAEGVLVTLSSDDPARLLFSHAPDEKGAPSITFKVNSQYVNSPDFLIQAFDDSGVATYTAHAPGFGSAKGSVALSPSGLLIVGPFHSSEFKTTPRTPVKIYVISMLLNRANEPVDEQPVAGGLTLEVPFTTSAAQVGAVSTTTKLRGGETSAAEEFRPISTGRTVIACKQPNGFTKPSKLATVGVNVELPGIGITGDLHLGKDLQKLVACVFLGEPAPAEGLAVTLTSEDSKKMILSADRDQVGTKSITLHVKLRRAPEPPISCRAWRILAL